jgi:integrase/recombinase XerD
MSRIPIEQDPRFADIVRIWREDHCLQPATMGVYLRCVRQFEHYCRDQALDESHELTLAGTATFATWYARRRKIDPDSTFHRARHALRALAYVRGVMGHPVAEWAPASVAQSVPSPLLAEFASHLHEHRGNPEITIRKKIDRLMKFLAFLQSRQRRLRHVKLTDIDAFLVSCSQQYAHSTTADIASSIRGFLRFLLTTGRIAADLAPSVMSPIRREAERPLRALPWDDVRRILRAVDRSMPRGRRDYAMLLMMAMYGLGAGEVIRLTLADIDWHAATVRVTRPKTGVSFLLPLLSAVARVLASYLRHGRPAHASSRHVFLGLKAPYRPLSASSAIRHVLVKHARLGGVSAPYLGAHVLRHTHACRQMEQGTRPKVLGDILGHRDPASISAYVRISTERLRQISLPVPT